MSRTMFGLWGAPLPQEQFAEAIAAIGVLGIREAVPDEKTITKTVRRLRKGGRDIVPLARRNLAQLVLAINRGDPLPDAAACPVAWQQFRQQWYEQAPRNAPFLRLEIDPAVSERLRASAPDGLWLNRLLLETGTAVADAVYVRVDQPDRPIAWEWPLRVGVLGGARSAELGESVAAIPWPKLVRVVPLETVDEYCDLLLLPDDLRGALGRVLRHPRRLRADLTLVIGGAGVAAERVESLLGALRNEVLTGGVGIVRVDVDRERDWVTRLFEELSHDLPIDVALNVANSAAAETDDDAEPPLLVASRRLAANARVSAFAGRYGRQLRRMATAARAAPPPARPPAPMRAPAPARAAAPQRIRPAVAREVTAAGRALEDRARRGEWLAESGDASEVPRMREALEEAVGAPLPVERDGATPARAAHREARRVNFSVADVTDPAQPAPVSDRLAPHRAYEMALYIGLPREGVEAASELFPEDKLPPARDGHWLDVFFVPLVRAASGRFHTPQQCRLFLPPKGDSRPCRLSFRTHGVTDEYRARLLIAHENRVIQTLIFSSPLGTSDRRFALEEESVVAPTFDPAWQGKPFDAAVVVNHASDGQAGFTTVVGQEVSFREPQGIDTLVDEVKRLLSAEATFPESRAALGDPALLKLFDDLARYGRSILKPMPPALQGRVPDGARIQIVEARSGAWLPVEIFYGARLPKPGAQLCPNARAALLREDGASHEACAHRDDRDYHCPLRFWGFSCVIERQPALAPPSGADFTISVPVPGADRLDAFRSALIGASRNVRTQDLNDPGGIVETVRRVAQTARTVTNWEEWEGAVEADSPSLLMLLPHSQEDPVHPGIPAMEIGGALLTFPELESTYVAGPASKSPVVLLLGCSTQLTDVPFLNFVEAFKREQAALVIGTLATIRGRRTIAFVADLLDGLKSAAGSDRSFGDVFLETKRRLLAGGDGFVLSLTAYGDVGWRI